MTMMPANASVDVAEFFTFMFDERSPFEIRAIDVPAWQGSDKLVTQSGYFYDPAKAAKAVAKIEAMKPKAIYFTLNPVVDEIAARSHDRIKQAEKGQATKDELIQARRWFLVDVDPSRFSETSSTDAELEAALEIADRIKNDLSNDYGWPEPIRTMSGSGAGLLYRVSELNTEEVKKTFETCLVALSQKYATKETTIDTTVFNASQLSKVCGTTPRKGSDFRPSQLPPEKWRPHRQSWFVPPNQHLEVVTSKQLCDLAAMARLEVEPAPKITESKPAVSPVTSSFDIDEWLRVHNVPVGSPEQYQGGRKWLFTDLPIPCQSHPGGHGCDGAAFVIQRSDGKLQAGCHHQGCSWWTWQDLRKAYEPNAYVEPDTSRLLASYGIDTSYDSHKASDSESHENTTTSTRIHPVSIGQLIDDNQELRPFVVAGVLRRGETANIIAAAKVGKSHLAGGLAWSVATGTPWLSHDVARGRVLIVDNELHPETLAYRLHRIATDMQIRVNDFADSIDVISLRGKDISIHAIEHRLASIEPGTYSLAIVDALYRTLPAGTSENLNSDMMQVYNKLDAYAQSWDCAIAVVHHASKGQQGDKSVTDVGAGAGAISRAADTHLVIRPHEDDGLSVLECVTRSFKSPEPVSIRFDWPLWTAVTAKASVKKLGSNRDEKAAKDDAEADKTLIEAFAKNPGVRLSESQLVRLTGMGPSRIQRAIGRACKSESLQSKDVKRQGRKVTVYTVTATATATDENTSV